MNEEKESDVSSEKITKQPHHCREQLCITRPRYRQGKKLTAVKVVTDDLEITHYAVDLPFLSCGQLNVELRTVFPFTLEAEAVVCCIALSFRLLLFVRMVYTINDESQHLIIRGVPSLDLQRELKNMCLRYGDVKLCALVRDYSDDEEPFTDVYHVLYARIQSARFAKHIMDDKNFFGGVLHVAYAPELETVTETRRKLQQRRHEISVRTCEQSKERYKIPPSLTADAEKSKRGSNSKAQSQQTVFHLPRSGFSEPQKSVYGPMPLEFQNNESSDRMNSAAANANIKRFDKAQKNITSIYSKTTDSRISNQQRLCDASVNITYGSSGSRAQKDVNKLISNTSNTSNNVFNASSFNMSSVNELKRTQDTKTDGSKRFNKIPDKLIPTTVKRFKHN